MFVLSTYFAQFFDREAQSIFEFLETSTAGEDPAVEYRRTGRGICLTVEKKSKETYFTVDTKTNEMEVFIIDHSRQQLKQALIDTRRNVTLRTIPMNPVAPIVTERLTGQENIDFRADLSAKLAAIVSVFHHHILQAS